MLLERVSGKTFYCTQNIPLLIEWTGNCLFTNLAKSLLFDSPLTGRLFPYFKGKDFEIGDNQLNLETPISTMREAYAWIGKKERRHKLNTTQPMVSGLYIAIKKM